LPENRDSRFVCQCLLLAQSGHFAGESQCPLLGVKRTLIGRAPTRCDPLQGAATVAPSHIVTSFALADKALAGFSLSLLRHSGQTLGIFRSCIFSNHSGGGGDRPGLSMVGVGYGRKCVTLARCRPAAGLPSIPSCGLPVTLSSGNFPSCIEEFGGNRVGKSRRDHSTPYADRVCVPSEPPLNCDYPMQNGCRTKLA
jgi:hypothetical protein